MMLFRELINKLYYRRKRKWKRLRDFSRKKKA